MSILDIFRISQFKNEIENLKNGINGLNMALSNSQSENDRLNKILTETEGLTLVQTRTEIGQLEEKKKLLMADNEKLLKEINNRRAEIVQLDDEILLQSFGFYKTKYALNSSDQYRVRIETLRSIQAEMVKSGRAAFCTETWTVNGSKQDGQKMISDYLKLLVRSFNNECDASIINVKYNNVDSIEKKLQKAFDTLNRLGKRMNIKLDEEYLRLKLQELHLCYEYQVKKQEEKEEQKRIKEQMREEAKLLKELEEERLRVEKEEKHFCNALKKVNDQLALVTSEEDRTNLLQKKDELEGKLSGLEKDKLDLLNRELNTRAGYVYIISNVGSFGQDVYKIGVTRRLDPTERVDELGDASVPFDFDIHALIFSDDAPKLETALHKAFEHRRLNLINNRREFFRVTLEEIEKEVKRNHNKTVEFTRLADAPEYRQSNILRQTARIQVHSN